MRASNPPSRALSKLAVIPCSAAMRLTMESPRPATGLFLAGRAIKALADARQGLGADARAVVAYAKFTRIKDDVDLASGGAIAHGVIQKIAHQQAQQQRLAGARDVFHVQVQA
ncbi:Uncharacterised protein [Klebsiella michiganensis]|nr:Uncharacterised protein [Klebsiella michiganensis]